MGGECEFGNEYWRSHAGECETETNEEAASNKHADVLSSGLNDCSDDDHYRISSIESLDKYDHSQTLPKNKAQRRPNRSLAYGANGSPAIPPIDWIALKTPSSDPVG